MNQRSSLSQSYASSFFAFGNDAVLVLGTDGNLWLEHAANGNFGQIPPARELVDGNVQKFQVLDLNNIFVLGSDGNLWLEQSVNGKFGQVPPPRQQVDGNVQSFQVLDLNNVFVLGGDGTLWREHPVNGKFGQVPPPREQVDGGAQTYRVSAFQAVDANTVFILDSEGGLYLDHIPNIIPGRIAPPSPREQVYQGVAAFQALDANTVFVLETNGSLILTRHSGTGATGSWPASGESLLANVAAFQALDANPLPSGDIVFTVYTLYARSVTFQSLIAQILVRNAFTLSKGKTTLTSSLNVDAQVLDFQAIEPDVVILGRDGNLWLTDGAIGTVPPPRKQIDGNVASPILYGTIRPSFQVLAVLYAPPGTNGGKSTSVADYSNSGGTGTTVSATNSFKVGVDLKLTVGSDLTGSISGDFSTSMTKTDTSSAQITKTEGNDLKVYGPAADGINHDEDQICLWLNPLLHISSDTLDNVIAQLGIAGDIPNSLLTEMGVGQSQMIVLRVSVSDLKNPSQMETGKKQLLDAAGLGNADYQSILKCDPFVGAQLLTGGYGPPAPIDPNRFKPIDHAPFQYSGPINQNDMVDPEQYTIQYSTIQTDTHTAEVDYGATISLSTGKLDPVVSAQATLSFAWTNSSQIASQSTATQSVGITIGGPSYGYSGPVLVTVYWDTVYSTLMFAFT